MRFPLVVAAVVLAVGCMQAPVDSPPTATRGPVTFEAVEFVTDAGTFTAILFPGETPKSVAFFTKLVSSGYYDGREFNRVIPGFVIQEVDRAGGATDQSETVEAEFGTRVMFSAGAVGIARNEDPDSGGSEFFVMDFAHSHLYGEYAAFAQVVEGIDVVRQIARVEAVSSPGVFVPGVPVGVHDRVPVRPVQIEAARVVSLELPADVAGRFPLVVGETVRGEAHRATLEWPRNVEPGRASNLTWYVYTGTNAPAPDLDPVEVRVRAPDGAEAQFPAVPDAIDGRVLHWAWTPPAPGAYNATIANETALLGWAEVVVPPVP